ncbi:MAG: organoarsenical effux MFS transporter ArsJ [Oleiphilaceae bacterium]|nr:organoarsenical effux MFS transporter ArsJ [Oleiphilaceae bacterium]
MLANDKARFKQYLSVTGCYWAFTLTDGALRMLVVLYFHQLGYSPFEVATLFLLYEFFGVVTNLFGARLAAQFGLNMTLKAGLALQIVALAMLLLPASLLTVPYVMAAQALSGIAKDLNKMSAKSSMKALVPEDQQGKLYRWVAVLTGSKNTLKGIGFFLGGALLAGLGFQGAVGSMAAGLLLVLIAAQCVLREDPASVRFKPKFRDLLSKSPRINILSGARFFLFGARDIWFVVALPVFVQSNLNWSHVEVGSFLAVWVILYGLVQTRAPALTRSAIAASHQQGRLAATWAIPLVVVCAALAMVQFNASLNSTVLISALLLFGALFAINSSLHSYLIVSYSQADQVALDVGFYYMANAAGRLVGTLLSGLLYQLYGLGVCLIASATFIFLAAFLVKRLDHHTSMQVGLRAD